MIQRDHQDSGGDVPARMMREEIGIDLGDGQDDETEFAEQVKAEQIAESKAAENSEDQEVGTSEKEVEKKEPEEAPGDEAGSEEPGDETVEEEPNPELELLRKHGLDRQFTNMEDALRFIPNANRHITTLEQDRARILADIAKPRQEEQPPAKPEAFNFEQFEANPDEYLATYNRSRGFISRDEAVGVVRGELAAKAEEDALKAVFDPKNNPRLSEVGPVMATIFNEREGIVRKLPRSEGMQYLYDMACTRVPPSNKPATQTSKANADKKGRASTAGGVRTERDTGKPKYDADYFKNTTPEQMERDIGFGES